MSKLAVVYCSNTGNTKRMAEIILKGAEKVPGVESRAFSINELSGTEINEEAAQYLKDSSCMIFGSPVVLSTLEPKAREWLMSDALKYNLPGKLGGAFATAGYVDGGGEITVQQTLLLMIVEGMLTYGAGGVLGGEPMVHFGPTAIAGKLEESDAKFESYGERMALKTKE